MGTNYYIRPNVCEHCGCSKEDRIHIGKSSAGWKFCFNGMERKTKAEWFEFLENNKNNIYDEYGRKEDLEKLKEFINSKAEGLDDSSYMKIHPEQYLYRCQEEWTEDGVRFYPGEFS